MYEKVKTLKCNLCDKMFSDSSNLNKHKVHVHEGIRVGMERGVVGTSGNGGRVEELISEEGPCRPVSRMHIYSLKGMLTHTN